MAELLGAPTLLVDPHGGPAAVADGLVHAARHLEADAVVLLDVGGDVLAHGDEPGLASPLADAVLLAAAPHLRDAGLTVLGAVLGAGCDGELTPEEVAARLAEVAGAGGDLGDDASRPRPRWTGSRRPSAPSRPRPASWRCAAPAGERGAQPIRDGRRSVPLTEAGGLLAWFDCAAALRSAARLAAAVADAASLAEADARLARARRAHRARLRARARGRRAAA